MKKFVVLLMVVLSVSAQAADRLKCGVILEPLDWNKQDLHGSLLPLATELCRAVAAAGYGGADHAAIQVYNTEEDGLNGLRDGKSDIVAGITPSVGVAVTRHVHFSPAFFYDVQGFMVHRAEGVHGLADITGKKLCYIEDTDNDRTVVSALGARGIRPIPFGFQEEGEMDAAIMDRHCQVTSAMISKLAEARGTFHNARDYAFLTDFLALSPAAIAVKASDARLGAIVDSSLNALLQAEFLGVTHANAMAAQAGEGPQMQRLLGADSAVGQALGLPPDWARKMVAAVGNYSEIYDRTVGGLSKMHLGRGLNALWNKGGLMAPSSLQ